MGRSRIAHVLALATLAISGPTRLAAQGGVSYLPSFDVDRVTRGPAWLPTETVRALGVVPFEVDEVQRKLRVVCAAPVPRTAMRALLPR